MTYKVVVIGGGPGGYVAAIRAAQLGAKVAVIEKNRLGGTCLNVGCIPTKALVASVEVLHKVKKAGDYGVSVDSYEIDFGRMMERKDQIVEKLVTGIKFLFKKHKISVYQGVGKITAKNKVEITDIEGNLQEIEAENIIIATGSETALIESLGYDGEQIITSTEALALSEAPKRLLIVGGGVIGCEFASIFAELGTEVTIVDIAPAILPTVDKDASRLMQSLFKRRGIKLKTKTGIKEIRKSHSEVVAHLDNGEEIVADKVLISVGRSLNSKGLGLEEVGVQVNSKGAIPVNLKLQTNLPNIYAIGDITDKLLLAHVASAQGLVAAENIMGSSKEMNYDIIPNCIFTFPEVASVGITSQQAEEQGLKVKLGKFPFTAIGKAQAAGETDGFVKIIADAETDHILGAHIVGPHATDLIAEVTLAMKLGATVAQVVDTIHAHPTLAEAVLEAAEAVHGKSIHI